MKITREINLEDVHLFETSVLGKPFLLRLNRQSALVLPCFNPMICGEEPDEYGGMSYFVFSNVCSCSLSFSKYSSDFLSFEGAPEITVISVQSNFAYQGGALAGEGVNENGFGGLSVQVMYNKAFLITDAFTSSGHADPIKFVRGNPGIASQLVFPNREVVFKQLSENPQINY